MRNTIMLLLAGPILFGCLDQEDSSFLKDDSEAAGDQSGNSAPTISGNPPRGILFGEMYEFQPQAADADGDTLAYTIQGRPNWATFNSATGRLYGQPTQGDIGNYSNIRISVSDGQHGTSLPAFAVTVSQSALGAVTLSWVAPTQNADGSPLMDLAGYRIYYRSNSPDYDHEIRIDNPGITTYVVDQLSAATYYFAATAVNVSGVESSYSGEVERTVN